MLVVAGFGAADGSLSDYEAALSVRTLASRPDFELSQHSRADHFMTRNSGNLMAGACLAAFGIYVISVASGLSYVSEVGPGPGFFPLWLGIGLVLLACYLMITSLMRLRHADKDAPRLAKGTGRAFAGWLALMVAIGLLDRIGFALSFVIVTIFLIVALDRRPALLAIGVAIGLALAFHLIFVVALDVSLPKTSWGF